MNLQCAVLEVHPVPKSESVSTNPMETKFLFKSNFFVMDKEHTMRALKARS